MRLTLGLGLGSRGSSAVVEEGDDGTLILSDLESASSIDGMVITEEVFDGLVSDDFNRADGDVGANWETVTGVNKPNISTNRATNGDGRARWVGEGYPNGFSANQFAQAQIFENANGGSAEIVLRIAQAADTYNYVNIGFDETEESYFVGYYKVINGTPQAPLAEHLIAAFPAWLRFEANGSALVAKHSTDGENWTAYTGATDASPLTSKLPGFSTAVGGVTSYLDNWSAGNL